MNIIKKLINADYAHFMKITAMAKKVDALQNEMRVLSDEKLQSRFKMISSNALIAKLSDEMIVELTAIIREADYRILGQFPYFVQLLGGLVLYYGDCAEMKTGEGKTLTSTIPVILRALEGKGVHVVTTNEYLSKRDYEFLRPIYNYLGLSVGLSLSNDDHQTKLIAYNCDITYTTNSELGFDYLRDSFICDKSQLLMKRMHYVLIDEVDSILIDDATTPLIISGKDDNEVFDDYHRAQAFIATLKHNDIEIDNESRSVYLTEAGIDKLESFYNIKKIYVGDNQNILHYVTQGLKANFIFKNGVDYVVRNDLVQIVDKFTGHIMENREYSDGLHQAIEAKEGVSIKSETKTQATITYQNLFRLYDMVSGMSGTVKSEEEMFRMYNMRVFEIPTNKKNKLYDDGICLFDTIEEKKKAIIAETIRLHNNGQPVLIGTNNIKDSLIISKELTKHQLVHNVLNGVQDASEAEIIARCGKYGTITVATNIAGRGTDIPLDAKAKEAGGLCILGYQLHESQRIDNQLKGRCARQGDPGYTKMFVSYEDDLIVKYGNENQIKKLRKKDISKEKKKHIIKMIQLNAQMNTYDALKNILKYDDELMKQRVAVNNIKNNILDGQDIDEQLLEIICNCLQYKLNERGFAYECDDDLVEIIKLIPSSISLKQFKKIRPMNRLKKVGEEYLESYNRKRNAFSLELEKHLLIKTLNDVWKEQVDNMMKLKEEIKYLSYANIKPEEIYHKKGVEMFEKMWNEYDERIYNNLIIPSILSEEII